MFEQTDKTYLDLKKRKLIHLETSLNQPQIAPASGQVAQLSSCFIFVVESDSQNLEISVGLFFPESDTRIIYQRESFPSDQFGENLEEAEAFASEMGFLMDNCHIEQVSKEERNELMRTIPFFYQDISLYYQALSKDEIVAKKSKSESAQQRDQSVDLQKVFLEQYVTIVSML